MTKKTLLTMAAVAAVAFSAGSYLGPKKIETREVEHVVYRDREVKDKQRDATTRTKETQLPDGTKIKETIKDERSVTHTDTTKEGERDSLKEVKVESRPDWRLGVSYEPPVLGYQDEVYGVRVERRLLGEIYAGLQVSSDKTLGLSVSIGF